MKTMSKTNKAIVLALVVAMLFVATAVVLTACNGDKDPVTTKYDATLSASITMGGAGTHNLGGVLNGAYVTAEDGKYTLTLTFQKSEIQVGAVKGGIFVDDNPVDPTTVEGIKDGTIGVYNKDGELVTEGVKATYSSGNDYMANKAGENVYYVKSVSFPVESLSEEYSIAIYINSAMMGAQFSKSVNPATVKLDLKSGEVVEEISGLGVAERGTVASQPETPSDDDDEEEAGGEEVVITKYDAELSMYVNAMGGMEFGGVLDSVYVTDDNGKYTVTLVFKRIAVTVGRNDYAAAIIDVDDGKMGYYDGEEFVSDDIALTYSTGYDYITARLGTYPNQTNENLYYIKSMSFEVASLEDTYDLALYLGSAAMSAQFDKELDYKAILTIDLENGEEVEKISGLGVSTLANVPDEDPSFIKYDAELSCLVAAMGIDFGTGLLDGAYLSVENGEYFVTLIFKKYAMNIFGSPATAFVDDSVSGALIGIYKEDGTLVTEGVELTYSTGEDYAMNSSGENVYYVKSAKFAIENLQEEYSLALYVNSDARAVQFSEERFPATLTFDFSKVGTNVDSIDDLLGVATRGEVEAE